MPPRRTAPLAIFSALALLALTGCAGSAGQAPAASSAAGAAAETPHPADTVDAGAEPTASGDATATHYPPGVEVDETTGAWVYSDQVAFQDLPQDADDFGKQPLDSLPELPLIDSLNGQGLADEDGLVDVGDLQQYYIADCMAEADFEYRWVYGGEGMPLYPNGHVVANYSIPGTVDDTSPGFQQALFGENVPANLDYVYDWSTAGCHGYAVHVTGQDDAN